MEEDTLLGLKVESWQRFIFQQEGTFHQKGSATINWVTLNHLYAFICLCHSAG